MATYEYKCPNEHRFEQNYPIAQEPKEVQCPECNEEARKVFSVPGINLVGRGFYRNGG
jgi:putative FmdB family regulatory protein